MPSPFRSRMATGCALQLAHVERESVTPPVGVPSAARNQVPNWPSTFFQRMSTKPSPLKSPVPIGVQLCEQPEAALQVQGSVRCPVTLSNWSSSQIESSPEVGLNQSADD